MRMRDLRKDSGSAFVELALVLPLLCLLLIGTVELGRIAYAAIEVSNAARAAVAYGSQNHDTAIDSANMQTAASIDAADLSSMGATLTWTSPPTQACACASGTSITSPTSAYCATPANQCAGTYVVYVQAAPTATVGTMFNYPGLPNSFTLHGFAQMRVVQD